MILKLNTALCALLVLVLSPALADDRVKQARDLILELCIAGGVQIEITQKGNSIELAGNSSSLQIDRRESSGLVGGISKEITVLSAQQASEARSCTQQYLMKLVNIILKDQPGNSVQGSGRATVSSQGSVDGDPETFWGGRGIWEDNQNYCQGLLDFLSASATPAYFIYVDNGEPVSLKTVSSKKRIIQGNFIIRTETGSAARFCQIFYNTEARKRPYNALACGREVSVDRLDVFASVYNQTLKDMRNCLLPAKWKQTSLDQGACFPSGKVKGECVRRFTKGSKNVWLYSNLDVGRYYVGIQTELGNWP